MPREIKTTIAVDGEAAFKRAINEANTSIRNMGSQLTLAAAQFKKDGDAMKLMETRSKALKSEIEQQQEIVKALEKAVKDSGAAFGENSDKTEKWEAELNRAKARLVNLQSELTLNNAGLDRNGKAFDDSSEKAADYQATLQTVGKGISFENITSGISSITKGFEGAIKKIFSFAKSMRETMVDAGHWADDLMTDATKYGMDVETLQAWRNAADFIDTDVETIVNARNKIAQKMNNGWTKTEGKNKIDLWQLYGINIKDKDTGKFRSEMDVLFEAGELLMSISKNSDAGGEVRADAVAMELFGKSFRELLPLFSAGQAEWDKTVSEQRVVSKEHVEALGAMDDANNQLTNSWETLKYTALAEIAPVLTDATNALSGLLNEFNDWIETDEGQEAMDGLAEALKELFSGLGDIKFKDSIKTAKDGVNGLRTGLIWLKDNKDDVETALIVIGAGFAGLKAAEVALNVGKVVSGFRTLWDGAKKPLPTLPGTPVTPAAGGSDAGAGASSASTGTAAAGTSAFSFADAWQILKGIGGVVLIAESFKAAAHERLTNPEIRGSGAAVEAAASSDELRTAFQEYIQANREMQEALDKGGAGYTDEELNNIIDRANAANQTFMGTEGADELLDKYNAWRQENSLGSMDWSLPPDMSELIPDMSVLETIPDAITDAIGQNSGTLDEAVSQMRASTESGKTMADKMASADFKRFNGLPTEMAAAVQRGAASGVSGIIVRLDGAAVGRAVAPYVNAYLGSSIG